MIGRRRVGNELQVDWLCACIRNLQSDSEHHRVVVITVKGAPSSPIAQPPTILPPACSFGADAHARQGVPALRCRNIGDLLPGLFSTMLDNQHQQDAGFSTSRSVKLFSISPTNHQSAEYLLVQYITSTRHSNNPLSPGSPLCHPSSVTEKTLSLGRTNNRYSYVRTPHELDIQPVASPPGSLHPTTKPVIHCLFAF